MPDCPTCTTQPLTPSQPAQGLVARSCGQCAGILLDLVAYRGWRERSGHLPTIVANGSLAPEADTHHAITCPKCSRIMTKYRVSGTVKNRLDFCASCESVWLDSGELELLHQPGLDGDLGRVFSRPWQQRVRSEIAAQSEAERLRSLLGADLDRVRSFKDWLEAHEHRDQIIALLLED